MKMTSFWVAMPLFGNSPKFRRNISLPSPESRSKENKKSKEDSAS
jgi:hypothetical protein